MSVKKRSFVIIGGGFSGLVNSYLEEDSILFEEHNLIGFPPHCTGLVSSRFVETLGSIARENIINSYREILVLDLSGRELLELRFKDKIYRLDRINLEKTLLKESIDRGSKIELSSKIIDLSTSSEDKNKICLAIKKKSAIEKICFDKPIILVADGVLGGVSSKILGRVERDLVLGIQVLTSIDRESRSDIYRLDRILVFVNDKIFPEFFGWIVPVSESRAIVGAGFNLKRSVYAYFKYYLHKLKRLKLLNYIDIRSSYGGLINRSLIEEHIGNRVILVGDAAGLTKPFTGGGLYTSLYQAIAIKRAYKNDFDSFKKRYIGIMRRLTRELSLQRIGVVLAERLGLENLIKRYLVEFHIDTLYIDYDYYSRSIVEFFKNRGLTDYFRSLIYHRSL
ncbi:MAG: NAD(P)/FAD-dependent oxidoreductase [Sulfolobales archaeon]